MVFAVSAPRRWLQINHRKDHRGGRSSGRRGGFYQYGATGINAVQHYQEQARAESGFSRSHWRARAESVMGTFINSLQCAREIISGEYGHRRRTGAASRPRMGGGNKMPPTLGASAKARSAEPCELPSRGKEQCGAALRGHACDDISRIRSPHRRSIRNS